MKKLMFLAALLFLAGTVLAGCRSIDFSKAMEADNMEQAAQELLEEKGFQIVASGGKNEVYVLDRDRLAHPNYAQMWGVQKVDEEAYLGKSVEIYEFLVKDHPLLIEVEGAERIKVWVMVCENEIIGGYTFPNYDDPHYGGVYSLEGKTLEEVNEIRFQAWKKDWEEKYQPSKN